MSNPKLDRWRLAKKERADAHRKREEKNKKRSAYFVSMTDGPDVPGHPHTVTLITKFPNGEVHPHGFATLYEAELAAAECQQIQDTIKEHASLSEKLHAHETEIQRAEAEIERLLVDIEARKAAIRGIKTEQTKLPTSASFPARVLKREFTAYGPTSKKGGAKFYEYYC